MKNNQLLKRTVAMSILAVTVWLFWPSMQQHPQQNIVIKSTIKSPAQISFKSKGSGLVKHEDVELPPIKLAKITSNDSATLVAQAYAAELSFPPYSQPLTDKDFDRLKPNFFNPQSVPIDDDGTTVAAVLSKYRYIYPEPILATFTGEGIRNAELVLVDISTGKSLVSSKFKQDDNNWIAQLEGERDFPNQLQATVKAHVQGKDISIALSLKYVDSIATLEGFSPAVNQNANMVMKADLTTREKGLYRVRANLFDANNQPIAHLVSKEKLGKGSSHISLKAHQSVLKGKKAPFYLSTFSIELMSPAPGKPTKYGDSVITKYEIKDFAVSSLNDEPYQPSKQEQQRLQLLQNMAEGR
jgi:hypothetical protein